MQPITITAIVDEKRRIMIDLPDNVPTGTVKITVETVVEDELSDPKTRREQLIAKLNAAGIAVSNDKYAPPDAVPLSQAERERIGRQLAAGKSSLELINEEREERL